jgi:hypothetical protein
MRNFLRSDDTTTDDETQTDENEETSMSRDTTAPDTTAPDSDEPPAYTGTQPVSTGVVYANGSDAEATADPVTDVIDDQPHPTFTPASTESAMTLPEDRSVAAVPADERVAASTKASKPVAASTVDEPLLANTELMRASWQQVQAGFVDDPKAAVSDAANLIDNTVQTLIDTLQQRQRQLRDMSHSGAANGVTNSNGFDSAPSDVQDTEQLRLMMHRYRSLFNQLVRS